ncbi:MAG: hypothetical protein CVV27_13055 [Candidatus Melainabacteria bacterium HGW-Melainabacteria-1]|nr:MAG: hypothetical protein CVV27_13055 [Candidatus Melainabacteria bacterium HGW-Melainabacteria-1]
MKTTLKPALLPLALKSFALLGLLSLPGACRGPGITLPRSTDPDLNKVRFSQVVDASANTNDFTAGLVAASLANAPVQDYLTINASPATSDATRLVSVVLRAPAGTIKVGASFPLGNAAVGVASAVYRETVSILVSQAYQASAGTLEINAIGGSLTNPEVEFHLKDAKMEPLPTDQAEPSKGSFVLNLHGQPTIN